jgi:hypothetical protein
MKVQLVNPGHGPDSDQVHARIVPALSGAGLNQLVLAGETIDVPDEIAGAGSHWRAPKDGDDLSFMECTHNADGSVKAVHDPGHGLLAQTDVWTKVEKTAEHKDGSK